MGRCGYVVFTVSLLLHLVVFWPDASKPPGHPTPALLVSFEPVPVEPPAVPLLQSSEGVLSEEPRVVASGVVRASAERRALRQVMLDAEQLAVRTESRRVDVDVSSDGLGVSSSKENVLSASSSAVEDEKVDARPIGRYRVALAAAAIRLQRESGEVLVGGGLRGQAVVIVYVLPGVAHPDVRIERSSGVRVLDEGALTLVRRAVLDVPAPLQGQQFSVVLPVLFEAM